MSGRKFDEEKPRMDLLSSVAMVATAKVLTVGAEKYDAHNWRRGFNWTRLIAAAQRHMLAFNDGEDFDPETGLCHLDHLACCVMFLQEHFHKGLGKDDRYQAGANAE